MQENHIAVLFILAICKALYNLIIINFKKIYEYILKDFAEKCKKTRQQLLHRAFLSKKIVREASHGTVRQPSASF
jgi:hypothetical protein